MDGFSIHAGDIVGMLKGNRLDEVASLTFKNNVFVPGELTSNHGVDELPMVAQDPAAVSALKPERSIAAKVTLKDGRVFPSVGTVDTPRPAVTLLGMSVQPSVSSQESNIQLAHPSELPQDAVLTFSVRTQSPAAFAHDENIEVTTGDESSSATLNFNNGDGDVGEFAGRGCDPQSGEGVRRRGIRSPAVPGQLQRRRRGLATAREFGAPADAQGFEVPCHA